MLLLTALTPSAALFPPDPATPARLVAHSSVQPLLQGYLNVTQPPYSAAGDGLTDDSAALQSAVDDAYAARMTVLLPAGRTFLLTKQLAFLQTQHSRAFGFQIAGGAGSLRPVLKLRDRSAIANDTFLLFRLTLPGGDIHGSSHYNSRIRGVDLDLGDNPGVSGLSMSGAQLCSIEDVTIRGTAFFAGLAGLPGSGGFSVNVKVEGGEYGVYQSYFRPNPSVNGLWLSGQRRAAVFVSVSRGPLVLSGFHIESGPSPSAEWRAVLLASASTSQDNALSAEDGQIVVGPPAAVAIESFGSDLTLKNVYVRGAREVVRWAQNTSLTSVALPTEWAHVPLFIATSSGGQVWDAGRNVSGGRRAVSYLHGARRPLCGGSAPPAGLDARHAWDWSALPTWQSPRIVDVMADYGATPQWVNATDDDGARIQQAIADTCDVRSPKYGFAVFIPHGQFGLFRPLDTLGCASLLGSGTHSTVLQTVDHSSGGCWPDGSRTGAMLISTSALGGTTSRGLTPTMISDLSIYTTSECPFVELSAGRNTLLRDLGVAIASSKLPPPLRLRHTAVGPQEPYVALHGNVTGKFFGLPLDQIFGGKDADQGGPRHELILVNGTGGEGGGAIHLYQASTEHLAMSPQVLVVNSHNVHWHAWKYESPIPPKGEGPPISGSLVRVVASSNISTFGASGNYYLFNATVPMVDVRDSENVSFAAMVRKDAWNEPQSGLKWLTDNAGGGVTLEGYHAVLLYQSSPRDETHDHVMRGAPIRDSPAEDSGQRFG